MLNKVRFAFDHTDPSSWVEFEGEGAEVWRKVRAEVPKWPRSARIYHTSAAVENDVTPVPGQPATLAHLLTLEGEFVVVVLPGWVALPYIFAVVLAVASYIMAPSAKPPPVVALRNSQTSSPNNDLSDRTNRARPNGRIADPFGEGFYTPDLISAPYSVYENNREVEYSLMCIGRGAYEIETLSSGERNVKDGDTLVSRIPGTSVEFYGPYTSPNSGDEPELTIGSPITVPMLSTKRNNSVNGQVLRPPNTSTFTGSLRFKYPNIVEASTDVGINLTTYFVEGDEVSLSGAELAASAVVEQTVQAQIAGNTFPGVWSYRNSITVMAPLAGFIVGSEITIDDISAANPGFGYDTVYDLSGTYFIEAIHDNYLDVGYGAFGAVYLSTSYVLVNPGAVNSDWNDIPDTLFFFVNKLLALSSENGLLAFDLDGTYQVTSVTAGRITLDNPESVAADWANLEDFYSSPYLDLVISTTSALKWYGPFIMEFAGMDRIITNLYAQQGLYKDNGTLQQAATVAVQLEVTPVDVSYTATGPAVLYPVTLEGSPNLKETIAKTLTIALPFSGRCSVRAARITPTDEAYAGTVVDEVRWKDLYSAAPVTREHFGNITMIRSVVFATASALATKQRKLTVKATRKIPLRVGSTSTFTTTLTASKNSADIFCAVCLDQYIGGRRLEELDVPNIYATMDEVETYFGTPVVRQFNYTFDQDNFSFEETANAVADAAFCVAYRRGSKIRLSFEKATVNSTLLFNHRSKIPGSETRAVTFGLQNDYDGLEFVYADPLDGSIVTLFLPEGYPSVNPHKVEALGIQDHLHAYFKAWRVWNRMRYQREGLEFEATDEANLLIRNDRILVSDGTRPYSQEGEVLGISTLTLTLSQPVDLTVYTSYSIWLQHKDGLAENIAITAGAADNQVVLATPPRLALVTDPDRYARTTYVVVGDEQPHSTAFLVTERLPAEKMRSTVRAVNYDARYYQNDLDFINEVITEDGYGDTGGFEPGTGTGFLVLPAAPVIEIVSLTATTFDVQWPLPAQGTWPILRYDIYYNGVLSDSYPFIEGMDPVEFNSADLAAGNYEVTVRTVDDHGNQSALSNTLTFDIAGALNQVLYRESSRQSFAGTVSGDEISISYTQATSGETEGTLAIFAVYVRSTSLIDPPLTVEYAEVPGTQIEWAGTFSGGFWHNLGVWQVDLLDAPFETSNFNVIFETGVVDDGSAYRVTAQVIENADLGPPGIVASSTGTSRTLPAIDITAGDLLMVFGVIDATTDFVGSFQSISGLYAQTDKVNSTSLSGVRLIASHSEYTVDAADEVIREWVGQANGFDEPEFEFMPGIALAFTPLNSLSTFVLVAGGNTAANLGFGESVTSPTGSIIGNPFANLTPGQTLTLNEFYMNVGDTSFTVEITGSTSLPADNVFAQITFVDENSNNIVLDSGYIESITNLGGNRKRWIYTSPVVEPMFSVGFSYTITMSN